MKILLTGAAGFIGMHTALRLIARGDEVVGVDNLNDYYDVKIDYINRPNTVVVGKGIKRRVILVLHSLFNFIALGLGWAVAPRIAAVIFFCWGTTLVVLQWTQAETFYRKCCSGFFDRAFYLLGGLLLPEK